MFLKNIYITTSLKVTERGITTDYTNISILKNPMHASLTTLLLSSSSELPSCHLNFQFSTSLVLRNIQQ